MRAHDDGVAVLQEAASLARRERDRLPAAGGDLEQAAEPVFLGVPEIVPVPKMSPGRRLQPPLV